MNTPSPVIVFDVNETLSVMSPLASRFGDIGAPELAKLWFSSLLRDGFALTAAGDNGRFAEIGAEALRVLLAPLHLDRSLEEAVQHVMEGMSQLGLHPGIAGAVTTLKAEGHRLITLTNGSSAIAEKLFSDAGIRDAFESLLSVEDAPA